MKKLKRLEKTYYYMVLRALVCVCACAIYMLGLSGCNPDEPKNVQKVTFPISFCLPAGEIYTSQQAPQLRAIGDPGTTEQFALPRYLYIYIVEYTGISEEDKADPNKWKVWWVIEKTPTEEQWEKKRYIGEYANSGDSIFQYTEEIILLLNGGSFDGRVYAVASAVPLTLPTLTLGTSTLADVLGMTFSFKDEGTVEQKAAAALVKANLQNIYSTPYNYKGYGTEYYGSFYASQNVPHLNLVLYHVAAKVDLMWSVAENKRIKADPSEAVRLTYLGVQHLYNGPCYVFKPMRNELSSKIEGENGYGIANIVTASDEGLWWEGRDYFYTIPYTVTGTPDYFPLQMLMRTNGTVGTGYQLTLNMQIDTSAVFVPWLRANFNLTQPLEDKSETKTVDY